MIDPNDKSLDEYLKRESIVSQHYREIESDDVPPQLDAAVLAQARAAVAPAKRSKPTWMKWSAPLALAASAVMVVAVVLEVGVQEDVRIPAAQVEMTSVSQSSPEERVVQDVIQVVPVPASAAPEAIVVPDPSEAKRERAAATPSAFAARSSESEAVDSVTAAGAAPPAPLLQESPVSAVVADSSTPAATDEADAPFAPKMAALEESRTAARSAESMSVARSEASKQAQLQRPAAPAPSVAFRQTTEAAAPPVAQAARLPPERWLERIRALRQEGKVLEADEQWKAFVAAYPEFEVAKTDSARPKL